MKKIFFITLFSPLFTIAQTKNVGENILQRELISHQLVSEKQQVKSFFQNLTIEQTKLLNNSITNEEDLDLEYIEVEIQIEEENTDPK